MSSTSPAGRRGSRSARRGSGAVATPPPCDIGWDRVAQRGGRRRGRAVTRRRPSSEDRALEGSNSPADCGGHLSRSLLDQHPTSMRRRGADFEPMRQLRVDSDSARPAAAIAPAARSAANRSHDDRALSRRVATSGRTNDSQPLGPTLADLTPPPASKLANRVAPAQIGAGQTSPRNAGPGLHRGAGPRTYPRTTRIARSSVGAMQLLKAQNVEHRQS